MKPICKVLFVMAFGMSACREVAPQPQPQTEDQVRIRPTGPTPAVKPDSVGTRPRYEY